MVLGIIAEYNPFHNGHLYNILKSKEITKDDYVVCIIGGNFTQRGEASLIDKWAKCEMALANGADLVIELPTLYTISSAENFADGAIKILKSLKIIDHLCFGGETDNINKLNIIANIIYEEPREYKAILIQELKKGLSFPKAREKAVLEYLKDSSYVNILHEPNNILAIEYLKAIKKNKAKFEPVIIKRKNTGHLNTDYTGTITSATAIREMIRCGKTNNLKNTLTPNSYTILKEEIIKGHSVYTISQFEKIILYKLRTMTIEEIKQLPDVSEGLENLIKKASNSCNTISEFINIVISKRYTETRIRRILLYTLLNVTKKDMDITKKITPYSRILGFNNKGKNLINKIYNKNQNIKLITSVKKFMDSNKNKNLKMLLDKDIYATNVYTLGFQNDSISNLDFTKKLIIKN